MIEPQTRSPQPMPAAPLSPRHKTPADEIHILDRLAVLYRYRYIVISVFVLTSVAIMIQGYSSVQQFLSRGQILIENERSTAVAGLQASEGQYYEDPQAYYNTQFRIIKGRDLTRRVIRKLHVEKYPEFNGTAAPPRTPWTMLRDLVDRGVGFIRPGPEAVPPKAADVVDEASLIDGFLSRVGVDQVKDSRLVDVTFQSLDASFSAEAVNALMDEYVEQNLTVKVSSTRPSVR